MKKYAKYKSSEIDWIGDLPEHWEIKKLKYVSLVNKEALTEKTDGKFLIEYIDIISVDSNGNIKETTDYFLKMLI